MRDRTETTRDKVNAGWIKDEKVLFRGLKGTNRLMRWSADAKDLEIDIKS